MIDEPPVDVGAVQETETEPAVGPWVALMVAGEPGTVAVALGVMELDASEAAPVPTALVAVTLKVYAVPLASPVTSHVRNAVEQVRESGELVTVYEVTADPPSLAGADHATAARASPPDAVTPVGFPGTEAGVTLETWAAAPDPAAFEATTLTVYVVPLVRPVMVHDRSPTPGVHEAVPGLAEAE